MTSAMPLTILFVCGIVALAVFWPQALLGLLAVAFISVLLVPVLILAVIFIAHLVNAVA